MKTLLVVDIQNDFIPGGSLPVPGGDEIVPLVNRIMPAFDLVAATQDWHPSGHSSFASNHEGKEPFDVVDLDGTEQVLWPDHCVQGSAGAAFHPDLDTAPLEAIFRKGMDIAIDSYSGFFDNARRKNTGLAGYLRARGADELHICGLAGDYCVYFTALDAFDEGFRVTLVEDAVRAIDKEDYGKKKEHLRGRGARFASASDLQSAGS